MSASENHIPSTDSFFMADDQTFGRQDVEKLVEIFPEDGFVYFKLIQEEIDHGFPILGLQGQFQHAGADFVEAEIRAAAAVEKHHLTVYQAFSHVVVQLYHDCVPFLS